MVHIFCTCEKGVKIVISEKLKWEMGSENLIILKSRLLEIKIKNISLLTSKDLFIMLILKHEEIFTCRF